MHQLEFNHYWSTRDSFIQLITKMVYVDAIHLPVHVFIKYSVNAIPL